MNFGVYNAILHNLDLPNALKVVREVNLKGLEVNSGGFLPAKHIPNFEEILNSDAARDDYLEIFSNEKISCTIQAPFHKTISLAVKYQSSYY